MCNSWLDQCCHWRCVRLHCWWRRGDARVTFGAYLNLFIATAVYWLSLGNQINAPRVSESMSKLLPLKLAKRDLSSKLQQKTSPLLPSTQPCWCYACNSFVVIQFNSHTFYSMWRNWAAAIQYEAGCRFHCLFCRSLCRVAVYFSRVLFASDDNTFWPRFQPTKLLITPSNTIYLQLFHLPICCF